MQNFNDVNVGPQESRNFPKEVGAYKVTLMGGRKVLSNAKKTLGFEIYHVEEGELPAKVLFDGGPEVNGRYIRDQYWITEGTMIREGQPGMTWRSLYLLAQAIGQGAEYKQLWNEASSLEEFALALPELFNDAELVTIVAPKTYLVLSDDETEVEERKTVAIPSERSGNNEANVKAFNAITEFDRITEWIKTTGQTDGKSLLTFHTYPSKKERKRIENSVRKVDNGGSNDTSW